MKVSIVTAVRNGVDVIAGTLASVAKQRFRAIEHIVIDGASTDGTVDVVEHCRTRVVTLISEPDTGIYDAFNKGLKYCTGDLIGFLNAGDRYTNECVIEKLVQVVENGAVDAVFGDIAVLDSRSQAVIRQYCSSKFSPTRISWGYMPAHPTLFIRRHIYNSYGGFDTSYKIAGDFEFVSRVFSTGEISYAYIPETLVYMSDGGLSNRGWTSKWTITKEMHRACRTNGIPSGWLRLITRIPVKYLMEMVVRR